MNKKLYKILKAAKVGCRILNALFGVKHERRGMHVDVTENGIGVFDGNKSLYEAMISHDPTKDAFYCGYALEKVIEKAVDKVGVWYAPIFARQIQDRIAKMEVCR